MATPDIVCPVFFLNSPPKNFIQVSPGPVRLPLVTRLLSGQSTKTSNAASDATIEAPVVIFFACAEWRGAALSLTGRRLAVCWGPFRRHQSNDRLSDNYGCSALFVRTACWSIMCYTCKCCCELGLCLASSAHVTHVRYHRISGCHNNRKVADSAIYIAISSNRYES